MVQLSISQREVLLVLLDYLHEQKLFSAQIALEREAKVQLVRYGKELDFLRQLLLDGKYQDADLFVKTIYENIQEDLHKQDDSQQRILFVLKRQQYLETLSTSDNAMLQMKEGEIIGLLKDIEEVAPSKHAISELHELLKYNPLTKHPDYANYEVNHERLEAFHAIKALLEENPATASLICQNERRRVTSGRLPKLLSDAIMFQWLAAREVVGGKANLKMDVATGLSEVSLVRDIVDAGCQNRFKAERLKGISVVHQAKNDEVRASQQLFNDGGVDFRSQHHTTMDVKERSKSIQLENMAQVIGLETRPQLVYMQGQPEQNIASSGMMQAHVSEAAEEDDDEEEVYDTTNDMQPLDSQESEEQQQQQSYSMLLQSHKSSLAEMPKPSSKHFGA